MLTPKIIILKPGANENSTDIRDYRFHSNFSFLKGFYDDIHSMTINAGDTEKIITIPHGLTYAPEVDVFHDTGSGLVQLPYRLKTISGFDRHFFHSVDDTNVYIKWKSAVPYNLTTISAYNTAHNNLGFSWPSVGATPSNSIDCGLQFTNVAIPQGSTIISAYMDYLIGDRGSGTADRKINIWGIDVDNLSDFGSDLGQAKTSATHSQNISGGISEGESFGITVTNEIQEIINRSGWSNGNALGFYLFNNGTDNSANNYYSAGYGGNVNLNYILSGSQTINFRVLIHKDKIA